MNEKLRGKLTHLTLALLLACGLLMPVLRVLLPDVSPARPLLIAAGVCLLLEAASLHRFSALGAAVALPLAALVWLFSPGSMTRLSDTLIALTASNDEAQSFYKSVPDSSMHDTGIWIDIK